jgi:hypothetical protein
MSRGLRGMALALMVGSCAAAPAAQAFTVTITGHPDNPAIATDATFTFSADAPARLQCSLDAAPLASCSSPQSYAGLALGNHSFTVKGTAASAGAATDTKTFDWAIVLPDTAIVDHPQPATPATDATFTFSSTPGGATFECGLDGAALAACPTPFALGGLAPGVHALAVRAVGPSGADPTPASFQWGVLGGPLGPGFANARRPKLHGGYRFTPKMLLRKTRFPKIKLRPHEIDDDLISPLHALCGIGTDCIASLRYARRPIAHAAGLPRTAGPPSPAWTVSGSGNDPQIAVGKSFVVVTSYNKVWFYTKAGTALSFNDHGQPIANPIAATTLFGDLWNTKAPNFTPVAQSINSFLNLPSGSKCDPTDPFPSGNYGLDDPSAFCLNDFYDMRAIYDEFRDRFWIIAIARNPKWKVLTGTPGNHISRRTKTLLAVSRTGDPRDGFYLYWWNSVIDDGACHSLSKNAAGDTKVCGPAGTYQPGDAADYPSIGISKDYFIQTIAGQHFNPFTTPDFTKSKTQKYAVIHAFQAAKLAGGGCSSPCSWSYWNFDYPNASFRVTGTLQAVVEHGADPGGYTWLTQNDGNDRVYVWGFRHAEKAFNPPLHSGWLNVSKINGAVHDPAIPGGGALSYANLGSGMLKAVERNGALTATFMDCVASASGCRTAARVVQLNPFLALLVPPIAAVCPGCTLPVDSEEWIPLNNSLDDLPGSAHEAGQPTGDVSKSGNVVVGYIRCCTATGPEARYAARLPGDTTFRPDNVLKAPSGAGSDGFNGDTGGAAADPIDPDGVWLANLYGTSGWMSLRVGKVLGKPFADLAIEGVDVGGNLVGSRALTIDTKVVNYGDGAAPAAKLRLRLVCAGGNGNPKILNMRSVSSGASKTVSSTLPLPASIPKRPCHVHATADSALTVKEYNEDNNGADSKNVPATVRGGGLQLVGRRTR